MSSIKTGLAGNRVPYARIAGGPNRLIFLPGLNDIFSDVRRTAFAMRIYFKRYRASHTIYAIGRAKGLPEGYTLEAMTRDCADAIDEIVDGQADVMGVSMGGILALHLAAAYPVQIRRLVVVSACLPLPEATREIIRRSEELLADDRWLTLMLELSGKIFSQPLRGITRAGALLTAPLLAVFRPGFEDGIRSRDALATADSGQFNMAAVQSPTLVISGSEDKFFPLADTERLTRDLPNARFVSVPGGSHAMAFEKKKHLQGQVLDFLNAD